MRNARQTRSHPSGRSKSSPPSGTQEWEGYGLLVPPAMRGMDWKNQQEHREIKANKTFPHAAVPQLLMEVICGWSRAAPGAAVIGVIYPVDKPNKTSYRKQAWPSGILCYSFTDFSNEYVLNLAY